MLLPAIKPDVALFHAPMADRDGNVWIGRQRELVTMAHAAEKTIVTVEKMFDGNLLADQDAGRAARCPASMSSSSPAPSAAAGRCRCPSTTPGTPSIWRNTRGARRDRRRLRDVSRQAVSRVHDAAAPRWHDFRDEESAAAAVVADLIGDRRAHRGRQRLADPGDRARCWPARAAASSTSTGLMSRCSAARRTPSSPTAGASCSTAPARAASTCSSCRAARSTARAISTWSASASQSIPTARFPGSFGSSLSLFLSVPKVILFRTEHSKRTLVPKVSYISAPGGSDDNVYRTGGPIALITNRCLFSFDQDRRRFRLESVHPGHTLAEVIVNTGFEFDRLPEVPVTPAPSAETLRLMRQVVAPELAEVYPQFAARVFGIKRRRSVNTASLQSPAHGVVFSAVHEKFNQGVRKREDSRSRRHRRGLGGRHAGGDAVAHGAGGQAPHLRHQAGPPRGGEGALPSPRPRRSTTRTSSRTTNISVVFISTTPETNHYPIARDCLRSRQARDAGEADRHGAVGGRRADHAGQAQPT